MTPDRAWNFVGRRMKRNEAKRCQPRPGKRSVVGSARDLDVLQSLGWAGFLTTAQIARLHFPSRRTAERRLRALLDHGFVRCLLQNGHLHRDNVHLLTPLGAERLSEERCLDPETVKPRRIPRPQKLRHALAVRGVFVEFVLAARLPGFEVEDLVFDEDLATHSAFAVHHLVPDALASIRVVGIAATIAIEVDLGTETTTTLKKKFESYRRVKANQITGTIRGLALLLVVERAARLTTVRRLLGAQKLDAWSILSRDLGLFLLEMAEATHVGGMTTIGGEADPCAFVPLVDGA